MIRWGNVTGTRVAMRIVSTLETLRTAAMSRDDPVSRHGERIAAAQDDVTDLGVRAQVRERRGQRLERHRAAAVADHARPRAEAAVHRAAIGREEQRAIGVPLHQMGGDLVRDLAERIDQIALDLQGFTSVGNALATDGAGGIVAVDERQVVRRDADGHPFARCAGRPFELAFGERERARELLHRGDGVARLPAPVASLLGVGFRFGRSAARPRGPRTSAPASRICVAISGGL